MIFLASESVAPSSKRLSSTHESDSDETEVIEFGSEEIEAISQHDIKDAEVDEESEDEVEVNSEEEVEMIGWGFIEMENSCTVIHRSVPFFRLQKLVNDSLILAINQRHFEFSWQGRVEKSYANHTQNPRN